MQSSGGRLVPRTSIQAYRTSWFLPTGTLNLTSFASTTSSLQACVPPGIGEAERRPLRRVHTFSRRAHHGHPCVSRNCARHQPASTQRRAPLFECLDIKTHRRLPNEGNVELHGIEFLNRPGQESGVSLGEEHAGHADPERSPEPRLSRKQSRADPPPVPPRAPDHSPPSWERAAPGNQHTAAPVSAGPSRHPGIEPRGRPGARAPVVLPSPAITRGLPSRRQASIAMSTRFQDTSRDTTR